MSFGNSRLAYSAKPPTFHSISYISILSLACLFTLAVIILVRNRSNCSDTLRLENVRLSTMELISNMLFGDQANCTSLLACTLKLLLLACRRLESKKQNVNASSSIRDCFMQASGKLQILLLDDVNRTTVRIISCTPSTHVQSLMRGYPLYRAAST